jgi:formylmethanofuran dehydrogenase subunit A
MFELPRFVIKAGRVIVEQGDIREDVYGKTLHVQPDYDHEIETDIAAWFDEFYSIRFRNYAVTEDYMLTPKCIACG